MVEILKGEHIQIATPESFKWTLEHKGRKTLGAQTNREMETRRKVTRNITKKQTRHGGTLEDTRHKETRKKGVEKIKGHAKI